jgi:tetratricopeptide (TPR) repeat protein
MSSSRLPPSHDGASSKSYTSPLPGLVLLIVLLSILYRPSLNGDWFLDDFGNIHENPNVQADSLSWESLKPAVYGRDPSHQRIDRPLAYLTLAMNWAIGRTDPVGYHVVNILIHLVTTISICYLTRTTLSLPSIRDRYSGDIHSISLLGALFWSIHPIQVTAVTYVIQRMAAMAALFSLLSLLCFVHGKTTHGVKTKTAWYLVTLLLGIMAFWSKQNAVMLPVSMALFSWIFFPTADDRIHKTKSWLWLTAALVLVGGIAIYYVGPEIFQLGYKDRPFSMVERLLTQPRVIWFYLWLLVYPISSQFALLHDVSISTGFISPWTTALAWILLLILIAVGVHQRKYRPLLSFGILFYLVNHAVESTILPLELVFEHRNYLPSVFLCVAAAAGVQKVLDHFSGSRVVHNMAVACVVLIVIAAGHTTVMRNSLFTSRLALWSHNVDTYPELHRPRHNLGRVLFELGDADRAEMVMKDALSRKSGARRSQKLVTYYNLGLIQMSMDNLVAAKTAFHEVVRHATKHKVSWYLLAYIALEEGDIEVAKKYTDRAVSAGTQDADYKSIMGLMALDDKDIDAAMNFARSAMKIPDRGQMVFCLMGEIAAATSKTIQRDFFDGMCPFQKLYPPTTNSSGGF